MSKLWAPARGNGDDLMGGFSFRARADKFLSSYRAWAHMPVALVPTPQRPGGQAACAAASCPPPGALLVLETLAHMHARDGWLTPGTLGNAGAGERALLSCASFFGHGRDEPDRCSRLTALARCNMQSARSRRTSTLIGRALSQAFCWAPVLLCPEAWPSGRNNAILLSIAVAAAVGPWRSRCCCCEPAAPAHAHTLQDTYIVYACAAATATAPAAAAAAAARRITSARRTAQRRPVLILLFRTAHAHS